ncbi:proline-rich transmembrane protein 3 [Solenopsis invicta]|uniref:proline-rich transmembrane protein 3 n=1 Tax=Solenopsis invicta TaxID=13686 RepID=UPI00193EAFDB|nr:proline-rich transmembrane protein 3 [Solenopsis invicta]XP_025994422.2 proline-rich transmembrane protein 3 [Solenopsis invicta]XP_039310971.1 proline-rich transmembrane protein 3 [Solenopsis invicta]XP_039310972.1 proline-rich transmembrane protein 3 [Solenopsis invicta]
MSAIIVLDTSIMTPMMRLLLLSALLAIQSCSTVCSANSDGGPNSPIFNLDHTALEKNLAAIFNKVAHSSATTKRSVPAYDAQVSGSTTLSTVPSPLTTSTITSTTTTTPSIPAIKYPAAPRATASPVFRDLPSYAPPSRALFTPPLPPEYLHPFADKPTLRGTNSDVHANNRRPVPPPSLTPAHERIPIRPPDLSQSPSQVPERHHSHSRKPTNVPDSREHRPAESSETDRKNGTNDPSFVTLHYPSISRILSGSNGRKQEIPDILLKPFATKSPLLPNVPSAPTTDKTTSPPSTITPKVSGSTNPSKIAVTQPTIYLPNTGQQEEHGLKPDSIEIVQQERLPYPQPQPPAPTSKRPANIDEDDDRLIPHIDTHPLESTWRIAWSLHVYFAAIMFTLMALYSIYKIVRFNEATNLLTQSYFLAVHLLLTTICTLRCFHLFYDAYNLGHSLPESLSRVLMYLPAPLLSTAFATLMLYLARCSEAPSLNNSILSPITLVLSSTVHIVLCVSLHVSANMLGYQDEARILPLICQCIYIVVCVTLGLCYMYVYRVVRSQIHIVSNKAAGANHMMGADPTTVALSTAITTTIATALLFILMGFVQLYGIFGVQERPQQYPWLWWGWQFSVRLLELSVCGLLAWVASLSQFPLREKQMQQHSAHSGFALFPCGSSTSTENMDDVLYPAICSTNQAIQNYTMRTGKQVYDDSFPLNTLPEHLNISGTFERHSIRKSGTMGHFPHEGRGSLSRHGNGIQTLRNSETRGRHTPVQGLHEQAPTSGSTMLVAEDGFVRFRSLGTEDDELSDTQSMVGTHGRGSSLAGSVRYNARHPTVQHQHPHQHQHSLQHSHSSQHQTHHQLYNNT